MAQSAELPGGDTMMHRLVQPIVRAACRLWREEEGVIIACSLAVFLFLYVLGCGIYTLGTTLCEREALQNAADAAAYSAATIQADALSRMAMVNRALAYTYTQMSCKQMDCITARWLGQVIKRFNEDSDAAKNWTTTLFLKTWPVTLFSFATTVVTLIPANVDRWSRAKNGDYIDRTPGVAWFCGYANQHDAVCLNGRQLDPGTWRSLRGQANMLSDIDAMLTEQIGYDKLLIAQLNVQLQIIHRQMCEAIEAAVPAVLERNLCAAFGEDAASRSYYALKSPAAAWNPYAAADSLTEGEVAFSGYYSALYNTEDGERRFLAMSDPANPTKQQWMLPEFFISHDLRKQRDGRGIAALLSGDQRLAAGGLDQWFVRGQRQSNTYLRVDGMPGLQRVYWDSNTEERLPALNLMTRVTRANHMVSATIKSPGGFLEMLTSLLNSLLTAVDLQPSVANRAGDLYPAACREIRPTTALYADYEWFAAKWFCIGLKSPTPWRRYYKLRGNYYVLGFPKFYCGAIKKGERRDPRFFCDYKALYKNFYDMSGGDATGMHGYNGKDCDVFSVASAIAKQMRYNFSGKGIAREDYCSCALGLLTRKPYLGGAARIYGDDRAICPVREEDFTVNEKTGRFTFVDVYQGERATPWVLNERFFGPDGTISVAVAIRRRNPWSRLAGVFTRESSSIAAIGNPSGREEGPDAKAGSYMWTMASARAAFRSSGFETEQASYRYLNATAGSDTLGANKEPDESGCVCKTAGGVLAQGRLWNLCTTDWVPTLVPVAMGKVRDYYAVEDAFVPAEQEASSPLVALLMAPFDPSLQREADDQLGWQCLSGEAGSEQTSDDFLKLPAPGEGNKRFAPTPDWRQLRLYRLL